MITQVDVLNARNSVLSLYLQDSSNGFAVTDIDGLDPVNATLTTSSLAQVDGTQPQNAQRVSRNLVFTINLEPDYVATTFESLRNTLYGWFMPKANITLVFYKDGSPFVTIAGQVESFSYPMYTNDPVATISVMCYDPDFVSYDSVAVDGNTTTGLDFTSIQYDGTSDGGAILSLAVNRSIDVFSIYNFAPDNESQIMNIINGGFQSGDVVIFNSVPLLRAAQRIRANVTTSALGRVDRNYDWVMLKNGINLFRITAAGAAIPYTMTFYNRYGAL